MRNLLLTTCFTVIISIVHSQALTAGDIAFTSAKVSGGDGFSFVTFVDMCPGTQLFFSDMPWRSEAAQFCTSDEEFVITFTVTAQITRGTVVVYNDGGPGTVTMSSGSASLSWTLANQRNNGFSSDGDNIFAFTGSFANPVFIAGMKIKDGTWTTGTVNCAGRQNTRLPAALTNGTNALFINPSGDGMRYTGTFTGTRATLSAAINNAANWSNSTSLSLTSGFTVNGMIQDPLNCMVLLPVELIAFNGQHEAEEGIVHLHWTTATETDNHHFEVSESADGFQWETIATVQGAGNSQEALDYELDHATRSIGVLYYRLMLVNNAGETSLSPIISVNTKPSGNLSMYPNPCGGILYLQLDHPGDMDVAEVTDLSGIVLIKQELREQLTGIDLYGLDAGTYFVRLSSLAGSTVSAFIKL